MAKLELDLKHNNAVVGSTSIDINALPQFSFKYYSARPNKMPITMNSTDVPPATGGLSVIGPQQPRDGFLSGNTYTVEVSVLNVPVGTVIGLSTLELEAPNGGTPDAMDGVIVTPINEGKTNAAGIAEFQVNFSKFPVTSWSFGWFGFSWVLVTPRGSYVDSIPQALVYGGDRYASGAKIIINPAYRNDAVKRIAPGQYGFWLDVFVGGAGAGALLAHGQASASIDGQPGSHACAYINDPRQHPYRHSPTATLTDRPQVANIPIAFGEGGMGGSNWSQWYNLVGGAGIAHSLAAHVNRLFAGIVNNTTFKHIALTIEVLEEGSGPLPPAPGMTILTYGGYRIPITTAGGRTTAGESWRGASPDANGAGGWAKVRVHFRRKASGGNLPIPPLSIGFKSVGVMGEFKGLAIASATGRGSWDESRRVMDGLVISSSLAGGKGGVEPYAGWASRFSWGGQNGFDGFIGFSDFGEYTTFA